MAPVHPGAAGHISGMTSDGSWQWTFRPASEGPERREQFATLCTLGNGVFATRGTAAFDPPASAGYPGTYAAGIYNATDCVIEGERVTVESAVRLPNWLPLQCFYAAPAGGEETALVPSLTNKTLDERYVLDLYHGILHHHLYLEDPAGRRTRLHEQRAVHADHPHLAVQKLTVRPENWSGPIRVEAGIDACQHNAQVDRYDGFNTQHLTGFTLSDPTDDGVVWLTCHTTRSLVGIALACAVSIPRSSPATPPDGVPGGRDVHTARGCHVAPDRPATVHKVTALRTGHATPPDTLRERVLADLADVPRVEELLTTHTRSWRAHWQSTPRPADQHRADILRLYCFHLHQVINSHTARIDAGLPARGLHGEEYHGRVFWDETSAIAWLSHTCPTAARACLDYRHRRLSAARREARSHHSEGARYPWQSGHDGSEVTVPWVKNPLSGRWQRDHTALQQHVGAALAHSVARYARQSGDITYLHTRGAEMIFEIARFYATYSDHDPHTGRFHLRHVVGPDEFHDIYPRHTTPGIDDNAYTNVMAASTLHLAVALWDALPGHRRDALAQDVAVGNDEVLFWDHLSRRLFVPFHDGVISQFAGYESLSRIALDRLADRYDTDLGRLDRLMEKDGDHPRNYQVAKQADTLMLGSTLSPAELTATLARLGYDHSPATWRRTVDYYLERTVHGSTLSAAVHASVLRRIHHPAAPHFYAKALTVDLTPGHRTELGIHLGAMTAALELAASTEDSDGVPGVDGSEAGE